MLALAVMLMHTVVSGHAGTPAGHSQSGHGGSGQSGAPGEMAHHGDHSALTASATMTSAPEMTGTDDCGEHSHDCVFTRAAGIDLPAVVLVLLLWSSAALPRIVDTVRARTTILGRPPPWAVYSHLQLQVIRC